MNSDLLFKSSRNGTKITHANFQVDRSKIVRDRLAISAVCGPIDPKICMSYFGIVLGVVGEKVRVHPSKQFQVALVPL